MEQQDQDIEAHHGKKVILSDNDSDEDHAYNNRHKKQNTKQNNKLHLASKETKQTDSNQKKSPDDDKLHKIDFYDIKEAKNNNKNKYQPKKEDAKKIDKQDESLMSESSVEMFHNDDME